jgi:hypothetical protein
MHVVVHPVQGSTVVTGRSVVTGTLVYAIRNAVCGTYWHTRWVQVVVHDWQAVVGANCVGCGAKNATWGAGWARRW